MGFFDQEPEDISHRGVDDWLMSYADMITLILCFFALLLAISIPRQHKLEEAQKEMAGVFSKNTGSHIEQKKGMPVDVEASRVESGTNMLQNLPSIVDRHHNSTPHDFKMAEEGERITTIELESSLFFAPGTGNLTPAGMKALKRVNYILQLPRYEGYDITVEGHTDDTPIETAQFPSNWELSAARAAAVVRFFIMEGISPRRLRAAGYADTRPKKPNRDIYNHPITANQEKNRRVLIKLEKITGEQEIPAL